MFAKTKKSIVTFLAVIIAALLFLVGALMLTPQQTAYAYNSDNIPTGDNAIANIYDSASGKFSLDNLNALVAKAGYDDLFAMITAAESGTKKTSSDFGDTVVNFGSYTFNGITRELTWIPAYVSKDDSGNAILTLWLANTANSNGVLSNQEVSTWLDGTYSAESQIFNGSTIYSNTYDGSYIRNYVLNGSTSYTTWSSGEAITPPDKDTMTKFSQFVGSGALASYIVKPSAVGWQMNEKKMKNDVGWCCENSNDPGINYPSYWTNDNLWLPSLYEVYDIDIEDNSNATAFSEDGGLWRTGYSSDKQKRSNSTYSWLRSGYVRDAKNAYPLSSSGGLGNFNITSSYAVRPALHLNLSAVAEAAKPATCEFPSDWKTTVTDSSNLTEITFAKTAPTGYSNSGNKLNTNIEIWKKDDTKIAFVYDGTITAPQNSSALFYNLQNLTAINFDNFTTDKVTVMSFMFKNCRGLISLDLSGFNTANVTNMTEMFNTCSSLKTITVSDSLVGKLSQTTENTYLYYGSRAAWYGEDGKAYTDSNRFSTAGTYTTVQPPFEVTVGTAKTYFKTLSAAWDYADGATTAATVKMNADATVGETLTVNLGKNIILDLNGHKLEHTDASGSVIKVNGTFTLNDSNKTTSHDITSPVTNQSVTIKGGLITGGKGYGDSVIGGAVFVDGGSFTMNSGTLAGNTADYGGGVYVIGDFIMSDGAISGNKAQDGGGVCVNGGTFTMSGGTIKGNNATIYNGGGVELTDGTFKVSGGVVIKDNVKGGTLDQSTGLYTGGTKNNVYLEIGETITVAGELTTGAIIGVYNSGDVATGYNQSEKPSVFFKADDSEKCASANNGTVSIGAHTGGTATCAAKKACINCGASYGEFDSTNHTPNADDGDCTTAITCNACGAVTTAATSHDFTSSYTSDGTQHWHVCAHSGCTQTDTKTNHNCNLMRAIPIYYASDPTCTHGATYYYSCVCGAAGTETFWVAGALGHDFVGSTVYVSDGTQHWKKCSRCDEEDKDNAEDCSGDTGTCTEKAKCSVCHAEYGEVLGHDWNEGEITTPATCKTKGEKTFTCKRSDCTETKTEEIEIDDTAHSYASDWTKDETGHWHAATCEHTTEKGSFATHTAGDWITDTEPQVGVAGGKHKECTVCGYNMQTEVIEPLTDTLVEPGSNGEENKVVVTTTEGFTPDIELVVTEIKQENYGAYESVAQTVNGEINLVYDVTLKSNGVTIQPDGMLTIKLRIPENLKGKEFKLFHLHENTATDMEYTVDGYYAVVTTDKLSEFIFVGEKALPKLDKGDSVSVWLILVIIMAILILCEIGYVVLRKTGIIKFNGNK